MQLGMKYGGRTGTPAQPQHRDAGEGAGGEKGSEEFTAL